MDFATVALTAAGLTIVDQWPGSVLGAHPTIFVYPRLVGAAGEDGVIAGYISRPELEMALTARPVADIDLEIRATAWAKGETETHISADLAQTIRLCFGSIQRLLDSFVADLRLAQTMAVLVDRAASANGEVLN